MKRIFLITIFAFLLLMWGCIEEKPKFEPPSMTRPSVDLTYIKDGHGRYLNFTGVNLGGSTKVPIKKEDGTYTYIGRPFPLEEADKYFKMIKEAGFNTLRLLFIWEAVEPNEKGVYDEEFLDYFDKIISKAEEHGIYVLINMHENLFSRHLFVKYNEVPIVGKQGELMGMIGSLFPRDFSKATKPCEMNPFSDVVAGDGAPLWAVKAALPEKAPYIGGKSWGTFKSLKFIPDVAGDLAGLLGDGGSGGLSDEEITKILNSLAYSNQCGFTPQSVKESSDFLPWTMWGLNMVLSLDAQRGYAALFAGDKVFPKMKVMYNGQEYSIKDYLQDSLVGVWKKIAEKAKNHKNVIGYDLLNEPVGAYLVLSALGAYVQLGLDNGLNKMLSDLIGPTKAKQIANILTKLRIIPNLPELPDYCDKPDDEHKEECNNIKEERDKIIAEWGLSDMDMMAAISLNVGFGRNYLQPLYERIGKGILEVDPDAIIWIEETVSIDTVLGGGGIGGQWVQEMLKPEGIKQVVFTPHWYPDIYPFPGINVNPRDLKLSEVRYKDYTPELKKKLDISSRSLDNVPVVFGEFGTYFNFGGIDAAKESKYRISTEILDNYYEAFENLFLGKIQWCFTTDNDFKYGDRWNKEDFSVLDPEQRLRGYSAFSRPTALAISGKPVETHFYSSYHYFDPDKGVPNMLHEFLLRFKSKETDAPTEIFVPLEQYKLCKDVICYAHTDECKPCEDGVEKFKYEFYVWISDGSIYYSREENKIYYYPFRDEPEWTHSIIIRPPIKGFDPAGYKYHIIVDGNDYRVISR